VKVLVNIVEDWREMEAYASNASRATAKAYQLIQIETTENEKRYLLRVQVGEFGFQKEFFELNDPSLDSIVKYCHERKLLKVSRTS
jgi:hypothetical protein